MAGTKPPKVLVDKCRNYELFREQKRYEPKDTILYALGIGLGREEPTAPHALRWTYELHEEFSAAPAFVTALPTFDSLFSSLMKCDGLPEFDPALLLHGEERVILHAEEVPTEGLVGYVARISDVLDKRSGALVLLTIDVDLIDTNASSPRNVELPGVARPWPRSEGVRWTPSQPLCTLLLSLFIRGIGGFAEPGRIVAALEAPHERAQAAAEAAFQAGRRASPPAIVRRSTYLSQALLYRLSGDRNPLHVDPQVAAMGRFERPILHGLCSFGIATTALAEELGGARAAASMSEFSARFTAPVMPGDVIIVRAWLDLTDNKTVHFDALVESPKNNRNTSKPKQCISNGKVVFRERVCLEKLRHLQERQYDAGAASPPDETFNARALL